MRRTFRSSSVRVAVLGLLLWAGFPAAGQADAHIQGFGIGSEGVATVTPGLSDQPQQHETRLGFKANGAAFAGLVISPNMAWDCQHDVDEEDLGALNQGFTLTSMAPDETRQRGVGYAVGRCTGWAPEYPFPFEVTCPNHVLAYARSDTLLQLAGTCYLSWGAWLGGGDLTLTIELASASDDNTSFDVVSAVFRFRA